MARDVVELKPVLLPGACRELLQMLAIAGIMRVRAGSVQGWSSPQPYVWLVETRRPGTYRATDHQGSDGCWLEPVRIAAFGSPPSTVEIFVACEIGEEQHKARREAAYNELASRIRASRALEGGKPLVRFFIRTYSTPIALYAFLAGQPVDLCHRSDVHAIEAADVSIGEKSAVAVIGRRGSTGYCLAIFDPATLEVRIWLPLPGKAICVASSRSTGDIAIVEERGSMLFKRSDEPDLHPLEGMNGGNTWARYRNDTLYVSNKEGLVALDPRSPSTTMREVARHPPGVSSFVDLVAVGPGNKQAMPAYRGWYPGEFSIGNPIDIDWKQ